MYVCMHVYEAVCVMAAKGELWQDCSQHSWSSASFEGLGRTVLKGPGGRRGAALLIPQDGVLVVKLQVLLHRAATALLSTTVPVFHDLEGLLHFSVPETQTTRQQDIKLRLFQGFPAERQLFNKRFCHL